jgi:hypothetical protein
MWLLNNKTVHSASDFDHFDHQGKYVLVIAEPSPNHMPNNALLN